VPTIRTIGPYRFYFYSHEPNEPPQVHVDRDGSLRQILAFSSGVG